MSALHCKTFVCFVSIFFKKEARYIFFFSFLSLMQQWNVQILGNYMESFYWSIESTIWWRHQVYIVTKASLFRKKGSCLIKWPSDMEYKNPYSFFRFFFSFWATPPNHSNRIAYFEGFFKWFHNAWTSYFWRVKDLRRCDLKNFQIWFTYILKLKQRHRIYKNMTDPLPFSI